MNTINIKTIISSHTNSATDNYIKIFVEIFSIPLSYFIINYTKLTANNITYLGLIIGVFGCILSMLFSSENLLFFSYYLFFILDFVDGKVARSRNGGSPEGKRLDILVDRAVFIFFIFSIAYFNYVNQDYEIIMLVLIYSLLYGYIDIIEYSYVIMSHAKNTTNNLHSVSDKYSFWQSFRIWKNWIPTRTSSPIFFIVIFYLTGSYFASMIVSILVIIISVLLNKIINKLNR